MKLAIMQPYFFPYIGYWQLINAADRFVIFDDVDYIVGGWINRNKILINDQPSYLTLPLSHGSPNKKINDIELAFSPKKLEKLIRTVNLTYRKAPYFEDVFPVYESIMRYPTVKLSDFLTNQLLSLATYMNIDTVFLRSHNLYANEKLKGQDRILDICRHEGAVTYINAQGGQDLYCSDAFKKCNVGLKFLVSPNFTYKQFGKMHEHRLSIIDVLMFNSKQELNVMLNNYELI